MSDVNPYQSPASMAGAERSPDQVRIARNIRAICILYVIFGFFATLGGAVMLFDDQVSPLAAGLVLLAGLGGLISAIGVLRRRKWGIPFCQLMSGLYLLSFPIGTILGAYFLLNIRKVKDDFR
ncbi:MAG: hypothetical protein HY000_42365 [Planctomycetes bacterium]|nr:hypothetical protein [Planctomycetota bacterium]